MAYINWLIFFGEDTSIEAFFAEIYVPLDCVFLIVQKVKDSQDYTLSEVYRIAKGGELIIDVFGTWSEDDGLTTTPLALYQRRSDLRGQLIRVTTVKVSVAADIACENKLHRFVFISRIRQSLWSTVTSPAK